MKTYTCFIHGKTYRHNRTNYPKIKPESFITGLNIFFSTKNRILQEKVFNFAYCQPKVNRKRKTNKIKI